WKSAWIAPRRSAVRVRLAPSEDRLPAPAGALAFRGRQVQHGFRGDLQPLVPGSRAMGGDYWRLARFSPLERAPRQTKSIRRPDLQKPAFSLLPVPSSGHAYAMISAVVPVTGPPPSPVSRARG